MKSSVLLLLSIFAVFCSYGYVVKFEQWQSGSKSVYLLADVHIKTVHAMQQKKDLLAVAKTQNNPILIVEDSFHLDPEWYRTVCSSVEKMPFKIAKTIYDMEKEGVDNQFLAYLARNFAQDGHLALNAELRHVYRVFPEDGETLLNAINTYFKKEANALGDAVCEYLSTLYKNDKSHKEQFRALLDVSFVLLTSKALKKSNSVFVAGGFQHILPVQKFLQMKGYKKTKESGKSEPEVQKLYENCVSMQEFVSNMVKPVDIATIFGLSGSSSSSSSCSSSSMHFQNLSSPFERIIDKHTDTKECSIKDLFSLGLCPKVYTSFGKKRITFKGLGLTSLDGLKDIPGIKNVQHIDLSDNELISICYHDLLAMRRLERVSLNSNKLMSIPPFCFAAMLNLVSLDLRDNLISSLDRDSFNGPNIERIYLSGNLLRDLPVSLNLKLNNDPEVFIDFRGNDFSDKSFICLKSLQEKFPQVSLKHDPTVFSLQQNGSIKVEQLGNEVQLSLRGKGLRSLNGLENVPGIDMVTILDISSNKISCLDPKVFLALKNIKVIDLSDNQIKQIPKECFAGIGHIDLLNLCNNQIETLSSGSFLGITITKLWLDRNRITHFGQKLELNMKSAVSTSKCEISLKRNCFKLDPRERLVLKMVDSAQSVRVLVDEKHQKTPAVNNSQSSSIQNANASIVSSASHDNKKEWSIQ